MYYCNTLYTFGNMGQGAPAPKPICRSFYRPWPRAGCACGSGNDMDPLVRPFTLGYVMLGTTCYFVLFLIFCKGPGD